MEAAVLMLFLYRNVKFPPLKKKVTVRPVTDVANQLAQVWANYSPLTKFRGASKTDIWLLLIFNIK